MSKQEKRKSKPFASDETALSSGGTANQLQNKLLKSPILVLKFQAYKVNNTVAFPRLISTSPVEDNPIKYKRIGQKVEQYRRRSTTVKGYGSTSQNNATTLRLDSI
uniref:Uncharacterized protein n=1 Tax=Glossina austeni TaxID=7395 RepID=A0A1A9V8J4_GLOAU